MRSLAIARLGLSLCSCQTATPPKAGIQAFAEAQALVARVVAAHPAVVRLTIQAVPTGQAQSRIIACNVRAKLGQRSDPEDLEAMRTKQPVVLREGDALDVTAPILDAAGHAIAATGITLRGAPDARDDDLRTPALAIAAELTAASRRAGKPRW